MPAYCACDVHVFLHAPLSPPSDVATPLFVAHDTKVLNEIAGIEHEAAIEKQLIMFEEVLKQLMEMVPAHVDLQQAFAEGSSDEQDFVQQLGIFLATFLKSHSAALESQDDVHALGVALDYMVNVSRVDDTELFKVCASMCLLSRVLARACVCVWVGV